MCELINKHKQFFRLEFFTYKNMTEEQWKERIYETLLKLEQEFNKKGDIRVHIHEVNEKE